MSRTRRIAGNLFYLFSGEFISSALAFVITVWLARKLTDEGFGYWAFVQAVIVYFTIIVDLGLSTYGAREIARYPEKASEYIANITAMRSFLAIAIFVLFTTVIMLTHLSTEMKLLFIGGALLLFEQAWNPEFAFQGLERMGGVGLWRIIIHVLYLIPVLLLIHLRSDLWLVPYCRASASLVSIILIWLLLKKYFTSSIIKLINVKVWQEYIKVSSVMAASVVVIKLYYTFDTFMLGLMDRPEVVGWYNAAYKIVLLFIGVAGLVQTAFSPTFSQERDNVDSLDRIVYRFAIILSYLGGLFMGILIILNQWLIKHIYGTIYANASSALVLLSISAFLVFWEAVFLAPLLFGGKQNDYLLTVVAGAIVNVVLNLIAIPLFSYRGAAAATICSNILVLGIGYWQYSKLGNPHKLLSLLVTTIFFWCAALLSSLMLIGIRIIGAVVFATIFTLLFITFYKKQVMQIAKDLV